MYKRFLTVPGWAALSLSLSGLMFVSAYWLHRGSPTPSSQSAAIARSAPGNISVSDLGPRHQLTYEQWVALLGQEARVAAEERPKRLTILAGDSLSLWFPAELLPPEATWLNQGISGETSAGLLKRLRLFDDTQPDTVFVMIGINDVIRGISTDTILANQQAIIRHLKLAHPHARIIVQSILPHAGPRLLLPQPGTTGGDIPPWAVRLATLTNSYIRELNQKLVVIAKAEGVDYLDLYPDFADKQGDLVPAFTTDGLHLSAQGYQIWSKRIKVVEQSQTATVPRSP